jgi:hypothetical protein
MDDKNITTFFREAPPREAQNTVAKRHRAERGTMRNRWQAPGAARSLRIDSRLYSARKSATIHP